LKGGARSELPVSGLFVNGYLAAGVDKANPAQVPIKQLWRKFAGNTFCPTGGFPPSTHRSAFRGRIDHASDLQMPKKMSIVSRLDKPTDTVSLLIPFYFCQRNFLRPLSHFCKKADDRA
jgi:hypothetical protein